jgi:glycosyltransferase involved in cell wall biosynthesis
LLRGASTIAILAFWQLAEKYLPMIRRASPSTRVIVDSIDLHFLRDARSIFRRRNIDPSGDLLDSAYASDMIGELNVYAMADAVLAVSQKEADLVNDFMGGRTPAYVVQDNEDLPASAVPCEDRNGILFVGNFWHKPNVLAAEFLCRDILPNLDPELLAKHPVYIVGNELDDGIRSYGRNLSNVRFVGWVPSLLPYLNQARVSVIPLLTGAGTKRKLIEALMVGTPTVSTTIGTEGLNLKHREHVLVADDPKVFADSMALLLRDAELWKHLSREGRKHILESHGRQNAYSRLMHVIDEILTRPPKALTDIRRNGDLEKPEEVYTKTIAGIREAVGTLLPENATVAVVSNGDDDLLKLGERRGWHFPQQEDGRYAGFHPANSADAIAGLESLRRRGAGYLLFPSTASWWLEYYSDFKEYLESRYKNIHADDAVHDLLITRVL